MLESLGATRMRTIRRVVVPLMAGGMLAGTAAAIGHVTLSQADGVESSPEARPESANYRETDHVRAYYATLRD